MDHITLALWAFTAAAALLGGFVKGTVGFAMPTVMISMIGSVLPADQALAALIIPTLLSNGMQVLHNGPRAALQSIRPHRWFVAMVMVFILLSAQLYLLLPANALFFVLGVPIMGFAVAQLAGWRVRIAAHRRRQADVGMGVVTGLIGGVSGVWGPPTVMYLTALDTAKADQMRVQGVVYGLGAVMLTLGHLRSGVLNADTAVLSASLVVPAIIGMAFGFAVQDRLDQARFRRVTLIVLVLAGANLLRRGIMG